MTAGANEEFQRRVAHDLKNPLGAAKGALELLLDPDTLPGDAEREKMLRLALRNVERALRLLDDLRTGGS
jgi:signal transduction histidine kinase